MVQGEGRRKIPGGQLLPLLTPRINALLRGLTHLMLIVGE